MIQRGIKEENWTVKVHLGKSFLWGLFIDLPSSVVVLILESLYNYPMEMLGCMLNQSWAVWDSETAVAAQDP